MWRDALLIGAKDIRVEMRSRVATIVAASLGVTAPGVKLTSHGAGGVYGYDGVPLVWNSNMTT